MTSRTTVSRTAAVSARVARRASAKSAIAACVTEALEDRKLFAATLVTVGVGGAAANGDSGESSVSANGRYVAFTSFASNLVAGDTNGKRDVFLRDTVGGTTTLLSKNWTTGEVGNGDSSQPVISQDGKYVAFVSSASNLLAGDTGGFGDVFRYSLDNSILQLASSTNTAGTTFANAASGEPTISADGSLVSFTSYATNFPGVTDANGVNDVFVRNMGSAAQFGIAAGQTKLVSVNRFNTGATDTGKLSFDSWISQTGRYITFRSDAANLVANDTNGQRDTFLRDMQTGTTTLISVDSNGNSGNASSDSNSVSGDGRFVTFQSRATNLVLNDNNGTADVFLRDTTTNKTSLLSVNRFGTASAGGFSEFPALSQDGSFATFSSFAPDIVTSDANGREDVFLRDLKRGPINLVSVNTAGAASNGRSFDPFISQNGDFVVYTSDATDMTATVATGGKANIFLAATPAPSTSTDSVPPTVTFGAVETANPGATTLRFTVTFNDNVALNTVTVGDLTVAKTGGGTFTATPVSVVGTGTTAIATYQIDFGTTVEANAGAYTVSVPAGAITDAADNAVLAANIGTFNLSTTGTGTGGGGGTIGDPNGPDFIITAPSKLPATAIGDVTKGKLKWKVTNQGPGLVNNLPVEFTVYISADGTVDASDAAVAVVTKKLKLKAGKAKSISSKFVYPGSVGDGNFFVLVKADSANAFAESNETNNVTPGATTVLIQRPFVDLQPVTLSSPSKLSPGSSSSTKVVIKNNGNVPVKAGTPIKLVIVNGNDPVIDSSRELVTVTPTLSIKNGKTKSVTLKFTMPTDLAAGAYQLGVDVDSTNAVAESDEGNNTTVSNTFTE